MGMVLYPEIEPHRRGMLPVGHGHELRFEECGTAEGLPAVFLHGGPGSGCQPGHRRVFDPARYRAILYDQRGAGGSTPAGETRHNTPDDLVADLERLRQTLGIDRWVLCGGSWGAALALLYAQHHPERTAALVLRSVFLTRPKDLAWFVGAEGAARLFPEAHHRFLAVAGDLTNPVAGFQAALGGPDPDRALAAARGWSDWESAILSPTLPPAESGGPEPAALIQRVRVAVHYAANGFFLGRCGVLTNPERLSGIPGIVLQGRLDLLTPVENALTLHAAWPAADLRILENCGHTLAEPDMAQAVRVALDETGDRMASGA